MTLDEAWEEAEAALPEGWRIVVQGPTSQDKWRGYRVWANEHGYNVMPPFGGYGKTLTDALQDLTENLREGRP